MEINIDNSSLDISSRKTITGIISIKIEEGKFFPEKKWNDSIVVVLISWIKNVISILNKEREESRFVFFEGPFSFLIKKIEANYVIEFFQGSKVISIHDIDFNRLVQNLVEVSKDVSNQLKQNKWDTELTRQLEFCFKEINKFNRSEKS
ncbi:hypothetical protein [uncultured Dysgonomonas sp.]|uniref:hypothetical protein n=1 Tax=uncultured Dysgonomonas sp. TaxID=206096 RepID=UPI00261D4822|nr:hypothetical protein [uncultured Dysgonomonas sp.]